MSYSGISIREAMQKINSFDSGWYLPNVQRQYVWGARYKSEGYICLLLDSILNRYPIGGLVLWETNKPVRYRAFLDEYEPGLFARLVEEGRNGAHKFLVYDGQQRLQTLRSALYHKFNGLVLHFNLLFSGGIDDEDETGFVFRDLSASYEARFIKLTEIVSLECSPKSKVTFLRSKLNAIKGANEISEQDEITITSNVESLWDVFVDVNVKSIAFFSVRSSDERVVNEIFRRLNTGGVSLTQIELLLSKIKQKKSDFEEKIWTLSKKISEHSGGVEFDTGQILQFFYLMQLGTIRIDADRVSDSKADDFVTFLEYDDVILDFFKYYISGLFKINHKSIIPNWLAVLPLLAYVSALKANKKKWRIREMSEDKVLAMNQYFLLSQFCDWSTQTMVGYFAELSIKAAVSDENIPIAAIRKIALQKNRPDSLNRQQFMSKVWFALKILVPNREYVFHDKKPQVDHIFPLGLIGQNDKYKEIVDVLWNFQPIPDGINNFKRNMHPRDFFNNSVTSRNWDLYDFIPEAKCPIWNDVATFMRFREDLMRKKLQEKYKLELSGDNSIFGHDDQTNVDALPPPSPDTSPAIPLAPPPPHSSPT